MRAHELVQFPVSNPLPTPDRSLDFESWVRYCFDRETRDWNFEYFKDDEDGENDDAFPREIDWYGPPPATRCDYARRLFLNAPQLLHPFGPEQLNWGFWYLFSSSSSGCVFFTTNDESIPLPARLALLDSVVTLYRDFFAPVCGNSLGHFDEPAPPVASACYMFWDIAPLWYSKWPESSAIELKQIDVMRQQLEIDSDAVREAALHGLGHARLARPALVEPIIDAFLNSPTVSLGRCRPELVEYARQARTGNVQ